jgi:hypothetical protein
MNADLLPSVVPDIPSVSSPFVRTSSDEVGCAFARAVEAAGAVLERAAGAEARFARGSGSIAEMVIERARADVTLAIAASAASRTTQALGAVLGMQV